MKGSLFCNLLLAEGAAVAWSPEAILRELGLWEKEEGRKKAGKELPGIWRDDPSLRKIWRSLDHDPKSLEELCAAAGLPVRDLTEGLIRLCLAGCAEELPGRR